jgi:KDO2-lipid IV(A) lauroyltransferase
MNRITLLANLLRCAMRVVPHVPPQLGYACCTICGAMLGPRLPAWPNMLANLQVTMPQATQQEREAAARRTMIGLFKNYFDLLRFGTLSPDALRRTAVTRGFQHAERALAQGRGLLIVAPHCGPYTIAFAPIAQRIDTRVLVVVEQLIDPRMHQIMTKLRQLPKVDIEPLGPGVARAVLRALRNNHAVILGGDRAIAENALLVPFFGQPTPLPSGPATLALRTGTPLLTSFMQRLPDNRTLVHVDAPLTFRRTGDFKADVRAATAQIAAIMATYIQHDPSQWLVAEQVWTDAVTR